MKYFITILLVFLVVYAIINWSSGRRKRSAPADGGNLNRSKKSKASYLKWVGGGLGWAFGGPVGAILGFAFGSIYEGMQSGDYEYRPTQRGDFSASLLILAAAVMKADEKIMRSELNYVRDFFERQFGAEEANNKILMLKEILKQEINVKEVCTQIGQFMEYPARLQLLHFLFGISAADNLYNPKEVDVVEIIAGYLGINRSDFLSIKAMFIKDLDSAYKILEISKDATDEEIKAAFRKMALKYHPDRVAQLGEDVQNAAKEKFQKLLAAYDEIKKQRGMV